MTLRAQVAGCGGYLPERVLTNDELARRLDTSDDWIRQRTGIGERRIASGLHMHVFTIDDEQRQPSE